MIYLKYFRSILAGFLVCCIIFLIAVFYQTGAPTESSRWIEEIYQTKFRIANSIEKPKLVIVSGSSGLFGISCKMIYEKSGIPCVNGGTHGGLDIEYILNRARSLAKPNDTVLLLFEYDLYKHEGIPRDVLVDYVFARDSRYLLSVDLISKIRFISGISFERVFQGILAKSTPPKQKLTGYQSKTLNEYGDETNNRKAHMTEKQLQMVANLKPDKNLQGYMTLNYGMKKVSKFVAWCQKNNIKVVTTWPGTVGYEVYNKPAHEEFFQSLEDFYKSLSLPIVGKPKDFMYDKSMFYDTQYHLNDIGTQHHTKKLVDLLVPYLRDFSK